LSNTSTTFLAFFSCLSIFDYSGIAVITFTLSSAPLISGDNFIILVNLFSMIFVSGILALRSFKASLIDLWSF